MTKIDDGGPAYPELEWKHLVPTDHHLTNKEITSLPLTIPGMTLRQHYAGLAMQALLTGHARDQLINHNAIAYEAVEMADELIGEVNWTPKKSEEKETRDG